jgi:DNA polymerase elongation subunit (family B)
MIGGVLVTKSDLVISKLLGQNIEKYRSLFRHVSADIQLSGDGKCPTKGDTIRHIYTDSSHKTLFIAVVPVENTTEQYRSSFFRAKLSILYFEVISVVASTS